MHPRAVVAEIGSLSLTTFADFFLNYCKIVVERHGVTAFIVSHKLRYKLNLFLSSGLVFLYREKLEMET